MTDRNLEDILRDQDSEYVADDEPSERKRSYPGEPDEEKTEEENEGPTIRASDIFDTTDSVISPGNDYELHENVAVDLVKYIRSNTIRNEPQFLLLGFAYASGLSDDPSDYISTCTIGTSSAGKTYLKNKVDDLYRHLDVMDATTGTDRVLVYSDEWDEADLISMGELQQPPEELLEFMKRAHGGDGDVTIRTTRGNPSEGFHEKVIEKESKSYHFTYAQFDADFEFWNRLLKIPAHESESKNRAVGKMAFGHSDIETGDDVEYGYPFPDGTERLQAHMLDVKRNAPGRAILPDGAGEFGWDVWEIIEPIFEHGRSEVNRIYTMVRNLIKASARLNFQSRETVTKSVKMPGDDQWETTEVEAVVAEPQDVANVVRCLDVLRATTHEIGPRERAVVDAINAKSGEDGVVDGLAPIVDYIDESDASKVNMSQLEEILDDLEENYLIRRDGDEIEARNWDALGEPRVLEHRKLFADCVDPMSGDPFIEAWEAYRSDALTTGEDLLGTDGDTNGAPDTPAVVGAELVEATALPSEAWAERVAGAIHQHIDGERATEIADLPIEAFVGATSPADPDISGAETTGTVLDPDHEAWQQADKPADWVTSETDTRRHCQEVLSALVDADLIGFDEVHRTDDHGNPVAVTLAVGPETIDFDT